MEPQRCPAARSESDRPRPGNQEILGAKTVRIAVGRLAMVRAATGRRTGSMSALAPEQLTIGQGRLKKAYVTHGTRGSRNLTQRDALHSLYTRRHLHYSIGPSGNGLESYGRKMSKAQMTRGGKAYLRPDDLWGPSRITFPRYRVVPVSATNLFVCFTW